MVHMYLDPAGVDKRDDEQRPTDGTDHNAVWAADETFPTNKLLLLLGTGDGNLTESTTFFYPVGLLFLLPSFAFRRPKIPTYSIPNQPAEGSRPRGIDNRWCGEVSTRGLLSTTTSFFRSP